ncbi:Phosphorylase family protein [Penicillium digitatum]|nr:Phosphorylase family protein [Penicillium digitatum]
MTAPVVFFLSVLFTLLSAHSAPVQAQNTQRESKSAAPPTVDKQLLAIQIGSIVGAYLIFVAVLLALLIFVGRRLRRTVQSSNYSLHMEILKPARPPVSMDPSPVSPMSHNLPSPKSSGFKSWGSFNRSTRPSQPSMNGSMVTIDESIVANDRERAQHDMEMLYAAVMEHDAQKASGVDLSVREPDLQAQSPDSQLTNPFTDRGSHVSDNSLAPLKSPTKGFNSSRLSKLFNSGSRANPDPSKVRSPRLAIRKMPISSPLASPVVVTPQAYIPENPPLSPRIYNPGPPPVVPRLRASEAIRPAPGRARPPAPLTLSTSSPSSSVPSNLPFREAYPPQSAPATKTTILERPMKSRAGIVTGMATPYSPYMPFTPVTPFTPGRIVTKRQRKREERGNGLQVLNEDDLVKDDDDLWG